TFNNTDVELKICVMGSFAVGKTSLVRHFVEEHFDSQYVNTIGATIKQRCLEWDNKNILMNIWDMEDGVAVSESSYLWGANAFLVVCDLARLQTVPVLWSMVRQLRLHYPQVPIVAAGNKVDLVSQPRLSLPDDLQPFIDHVVFTSAKTGENVYRLFSVVVSKILSPILASS
ncbi:MAG: GTP-binding protein, partial [Anaerolineales bacterium]|nr:GTP-binding protein [Anaerolineales bacterium]